MTKLLPSLLVTAMFVALVGFANVGLNTDHNNISQQTLQSMGQIA